MKTHNYVIIGAAILALLAMIAYLVYEKVHAEQASTLAVAPATIAKQFPNISVPAPGTLSANTGVVGAKITGQ